jgi:flagellar biogenesis protein FliO
VLALCVAVIFGIRKWQQKHGMLPTAGGPSPSRVLETVVIGNRQTISLVQLQGLQAVVGCDATGIKSIVLAPPRFEDELPTDGAVEDLSEADADQSTSSADSTFAQQSLAH